jgi:hypothetical protein
MFGKLIAAAGGMRRCHDSRRTRPERRPGRADHRVGVGYRRRPATLEAGTKLRITVTNRGGVLHELVLENGNCVKQPARPAQRHR